MVKISQEEQDKIRENKRRETVEQELRRESQDKTDASLNKQKEGIEKTRNSYYEYSKEYKNILEERRRTLGTESGAAMILQMEFSLKAFAKLDSSLKSLIFKQAWLKMSENFNYNTFTPLMMIDEGGRWIRIKVDKLLNTEGRFSAPLPPMLVPYLADVDENGKLITSLDVENAEMTAQDRQDFVSNFERDFKDSMEKWISEAVDPNSATGELRFRLEGNPQIIIDNRTNAAVTQEEFKKFRDDTLKSELEHYFGVEFVPKPSEPTQAPRTSP